MLSTLAWSRAIGWGRSCWGLLTTWMGSPCPTFPTVKTDSTGPNYRLPPVPEMGAGCPCLNQSPFPGRSLGRLGEPQYRVRGAASRQNLQAVAGETDVPA